MTFGFCYAKKIKVIEKQKKALVFAGIQLSIESH